MKGIEELVRTGLCDVLGRDDLRPDGIDLDRNLFEGYGLTSLNMVMLMTGLCDEAGIALTAFTDRDIVALKTPRDIAALLARAGTARLPWESARDAVLEDDHLLLRRIDPRDIDQFRAIAFDPDIWRYFVFRVETDADLERFVAEAVDDTAQGRRVVFGIVDKASGRIAGSMAFGNMAEKELRLEIGWSWLGRGHRGTGVNARAKLLLLRLAFDRLGCERVEFKTDALNQPARRGLRNIGATEEGILRSFNFMPDNRRRDAVYYSILKAEWPEVKAMLERRRVEPRAAADAVPA